MNHVEEFQLKLTARRRLAVLYFIREEPDRIMSQSLLHIALETYLYQENSDVLTRDAEFLRKAGLLTLEHIGPLPALRLTDAGAEVVKGTRTVAGVQKPPLD